MMKTTTETEIILVAINHMPREIQVEEKRSAVPETLGGRKCLGMHSCCCRTVKSLKWLKEIVCKG
jgi:hypothetical protein